MTFCKVRKLSFNLEWYKFSKLSFTAVINSSMYLGAALCCRDWIVLKYPRSNTFRLGLFGGWLMIWMLRSSFSATLQNSASVGVVCGRAASCCILITGFVSVLGHFSLITGRSFSIWKFLYCTFVTDVITFVTAVPAGLLRLLFLAFSIVVNNQMPSLPSNLRFRHVSQRGRVTAAKNMTFVPNLLLFVFLWGSSSPGAR